MKSLLLASFLLTGCASPSRFPMPDNDPLGITRAEWENARLAAHLLNQ